jgi:ABC-type spermidine/putrescine transport system permease subunit II
MAATGRDGGPPRRLPGNQVILWGVLAFLYLPVLVLAVYSFNASRFALSWEGFTLEWYLRVFTNPEIGRAVRNTLVVSTVSTAVSTALGTALAMGLHFHRFRGRDLLQGGFYLPILIPDIILAVALLSFFALVAFPLGLGSIILAHVSFQISFVALLVRARLQAFPVSLVEAARDLGARPARWCGGWSFPWRRRGSWRGPWWRSPFRWTIFSSPTSPPERGRPPFPSGSTP